MSVDVNTTYALIVDEDQGTPINDPDERAWNGGAGLTTFDAALATAVLSVAGADPTTDFPTPQLAVDADLISFSGTVTNLSLASTAGAAYPAGGVNSGLTTADGQAIWLFEGPNNDIVVGRIGAADPNGRAAFVIAVDEDRSGLGGAVVDAKMWIVQYAAVSHGGVNVVEGDVRTLLDKVFLASTTTTETTHVFSDFSDVPAGAPIFAMIADDTQVGGVSQAGAVDFLVTAFNVAAPATGITVNVSNQGSFPGSLASGTQNITPGTGLRFDVVTDGVNAYSQSDGKQDAKIDFNTHTEVVEAGFTIVQNQGGRPTDILIKAYDVNADADQADGHAFFTSLAAGKQTLETITDVRVFVINANGSEGQLLYDNSPKAGEVNPNLVTVTFNGDGTVQVDNVLLNYTVQIGTAAGFERFTVTNVSPESNAYIDLGRLTYTTSSTTSVNDVDEIGSRIQIDDSGPTIQAVAATAGSMAEDDDDLTTNATGNFAGLFTMTNGADGAAVGGPTYALGTPGGASGLVDAESNQAIFLRTSGATVEGYFTVGGSDTTVFVLTVDGAGVVTCDQQRAIEHVVGGVATNDPIGLSSASLITLAATITDKDGDHQTATANIGGALLFADAQPTISAQPTNMSLSYTAGSSDSETFAVDFHNDVQGTVTFNTASLVYDGPLTPVFVTGVLLEFQDGSGEPVFHVDLTNGDYTVTVDQSSAPGDPQPLLFSAISAGGPRETLSVELADHSDSIVFNGLLTNGSAQLYDPGGATTDDDLNPDSLGFGVKGLQASQINPGEGWAFATLSEKELDNLTFDVQAIGGLKTVTVAYTLYEDNGTADTTDDDAIYSGSMVLALPKGNNTVEVSLEDPGGDSFDYGIVQFLFPANPKTLIVDPNQGVRVLDFTATERGPSQPDDFSIRLNVTDTDQDSVVTSLFHVDLTI